MIIAFAVFSWLVALASVCALARVSQKCTDTLIAFSKSSSEAVEKMAKVFLQMSEAHANLVTAKDAVISAKDKHIESLEISVEMFQEMLGDEEVVESSVLTQTENKVRHVDDVKSTIDTRSVAARMAIEMHETLANMAGTIEAFKDKIPQNIYDEFTSVLKKGKEIN